MELSKTLRCFRIGEHSLPFPARAHEGDAGIDLRANTVLPDGSIAGIIVPPGKTSAAIGVGFGFSIPKGYYGQIAGRSSLNLKGIVTMPGVIDSGYLGEVKLVFCNVGSEYLHILHGDRVAQIIFLPIFSQPIVEVSYESVQPTERGANGFGSTGKL